MINYFFRDTIDAENCRIFNDIVESYPEVRFFQPSPDKAPWHVQALLAEGEIELNFWPHKMKGQRRPMYAVEGEYAIRDIIEQAIEDGFEHGEEDFDVLEG